MTQPTLSQRELECLEWVSFGKTSWETAIILGVSERTINFHLLNACRKLNVYGRQAAVALALRQNLLHGLTVKRVVTPPPEPAIQRAIAEPANA